MIPDKTLIRDKGQAPIPSFSPIPSKCTAPVVIDPGATHTVDVANEKLLAILFSASGDIKLYINDQSANVLTFESWRLHSLLLNHTIQTITFYNSGTSAVTLERWGM